MPAVVLVAALTASCGSPSRVDAGGSASTTAAAATTAAGGTTVAPPADPAAASVDLLTTTIDADGPGCSAAVGRDGEIAWLGARGLADVAAGVPITPDTVFDVGSISKQFTAAAVLLLERDGALATSDPVGEHLAGLPAWAADTTLEQLVEHAGGIPDLFDVAQAQGHTFAQPFTQADALRLIAGMERNRFHVGTTHYSNTGYVLLAEVVRAVAGVPLPEFLRQRVFAPLDLAMTMDQLAAPPGKATSHAMDGTPDPLVPWDLTGPGGIQTTPSELVRWGDHYRTGALGGAAFVEAQLADPSPDGGHGYAAGLVVRDDGVIGHVGRWSHYASEFWVSADRHVVVAVSCNAVIDREIAPRLLALWAT